MKKTFLERTGGKKSSLKWEDSISCNIIFICLSNSASSKLIYFGKFLFKFHFLIHLALQIVKHKLWFENKEARHLSSFISFISILISYSTQICFWVNWKHRLILLCVTYFDLYIMYVCYIYGVICLSCTS